MLRDSNVRTTLNTYSHTHRYIAERKAEWKIDREAVEGVYLLEDMVGTRRLELLTSTVSIDK
jgi:hypothetical protein